VYHPHAGIAAEAVLSGHLKHGGVLRRSAAQVANRLNVKRRRFAAIERRMLSAPRPPLVLCLSDYVAGNLREHYPAAPAAKLFNAIDLEKFDPGRRIDAGMVLRRKLGISASKTVALMIAQDYQRKGLREAMLALAKVDDPQLLLLVAGKEDPAPYRRLAGELKIEERVVFAGSTDDPYSFYKAADFFVLPTRHDPCSLVVLEALAMGLPVISTRRNGACEIMTDGVHGSVLSDPRDVAALAEAMRKWVDPGLRRAASELCLGLREGLSYPAHLRRLEELYELARGR
jgi:UDP-glucose:(heptosyl)LPS alpha-1,3-glucosyltransferase